MYTIEAKRDNQSFNNISLSSPSLGSTGLGLRWTRTYLDIWWQSKDLDFRLENEIFVLFCFQKHIIRLFRCFANQCCDRSCQKWEKKQRLAYRHPQDHIWGLVPWSEDQRRLYSVLAGILWAGAEKANFARLCLWGGDNVALRNVFSDLSAFSELGPWLQAGPCCHQAWATCAPIRYKV